MIPGAELFDGDAEAIGDGDEGVAAAHGVALTGSEAAGGGDGNDELVAGLDGIGEGVEGSDFGGAGVERLGDLIEGLTIPDDVEAPAGAIFFRNIFEAGEEDVAGAGRKVEAVGNVVGGGEAEERGVEGDDLVEGGVGEVGDETHVDGVVGGDVVGEDGGVGNDGGEAVLLRIFGHDGGGDDGGHVSLGGGGESVEAVELPEVGVPGFGDGVLDAAGAPVVGGHGEVPVAELVVEGLHVAGVGEGGLFGIEALVEEAVALEAVGAAEGHELPHAAGTGTGVDDLGLEAGLGYGEIDEVLGDALRGEIFGDHGAIFPGALEGAGEVGVAVGVVGEVADPAGNVVVDDEGEIGLGGFKFSRDFADEFGVGLEGDFVSGFGGSFVDLAGEAVALLEGDDFERVDGGDELIEFVGELGIFFEVQAGGEHGVDGEVEVLAGGVEAIGVEVGDAGLVAGLGPGDESLDFLGVLGGDDLVGGLLSLGVGLGLGGGLSAWVGLRELGGGGVGGRGSGGGGAGGVRRAAGEEQA